MRKILSAIVLIGFYMALVAIFMEVGVRMTRAAPPATSAGWFWQVPDSNTGWSLLPNAQGRSFAPMYEYDVAVEINSKGLRADESIGYEKPDDVYRIMILGDSFVEAMQVELDQSFPQRLGRIYAEETGKRVEVLNAGVSGWGTDQQLLWLQAEGHKYRPDLILLSVYPRNDFMNNSEHLEAANQGSIQKPFFVLDGDELHLNYHPFDPALVSPPVVDEIESAPRAMEPGPLTGLASWLHDHSALYRYVDPRIRLEWPGFAAALAQTGLIKPGQESKIAAQPVDSVPIAYGVYQRVPDETWQVATAITAALFAEFQVTAAALGSATGAVLIGAPEQVYNKEWQRVLDTYPLMHTWDWDLDAPQQRAAEALTAAGLPYLDLLPVFRQVAADSVSLHLDDDGHWTAEGHELAAQASFNFLATNALLPDIKSSQIPLVAPTESRSPWEWFVWLVLLLVLGSLLWDMVKAGPVRWVRKATVGVSTAGELLGYMAYRRHYALLPLIIVLLLFAGILILAQASVVGPFIYTLI